MEIHYKWIKFGDQKHSSTLIGFSGLWRNQILLRAWYEVCVACTVLALKKGLMLLSMSCQLVLFMAQVQVLVPVLVFSDHFLSFSLFLQLLASEGDEVLRRVLERVGESRHSSGRGQQRRRSRRAGRGRGPACRSRSCPGGRWRRCSCCRTGRGTCSGSFGRSCSGREEGFGFGRFRNCDSIEVEVQEQETQRGGWSSIPEMLLFGVSVDRFFYFFVSCLFLFLLLLIVSLSLYFIFFLFSLSTNFVFK